MRFQKVFVLLLTVACAFTFILSPTSTIVQAQEKEAEKAERTPEEIAAARRAAARRRRGPSIAKYNVGEKVVSIQSSQLRTDGKDYESLQNIESGNYMRMTKGSAIKLKTDLDLSFGDLKAKYGNAAPNYPGVYSVWLKKTDSGWKMALNEKADVWGTQYDSAHDIGEIDIAYSKASKASEKLVFALKENNDSVDLTITFGTHQWATSFTVDQ